MSFTKLLYRKCLSKWFSVIMVFVLLLNGFEIAYSKMNLSPYPTPDEINFLPKWAQVVVLTGPRTNPPPNLMRERKKLKEQYGDMAIDAGHHFAAALNWINRYYRSIGDNYKGVAEDRIFALKKAIDEFQFMRGRLSRADSLYAMLLFYEAIVYREQGNFFNANKNYREIIDLRPKYPAGYINYADFLKSVGRSEDAQKILSIGLEKTDGSEAIKKHMEKN